MPMHDTSPTTTRRWHPVAHGANAVLVNHRD
jgi:hypothetical protein